jgi:hypothetical protein
MDLKETSDTISHQVAQAFCILSVHPRAHTYCVLFLEAMRRRALWYVYEHIHMYFMVSMRVWPLHALAHILLCTCSVGSVTEYDPNMYEHIQYML